jgi:hypothetical protein
MAVLRVIGPCVIMAILKLLGILAVNYCRPTNHDCNEMEFQWHFSFIDFPNPSFLHSFGTCQFTPQASYPSIQNIPEIMNLLRLPIFLSLVCTTFVWLIAATAKEVRYVGAMEVFLSPDGSGNQVFKAQNLEVTPDSLARELVGYLGKIDGKDWSVSNGEPGGGGIVLAMPGSSLVSAEDWAALSKLNKEGYMLQARERQIVLAGNSVLALQHAMFDLLERLGSRFLTPAEAWTIIPEGTGLKLEEGKYFEEPDFVSRQAFFTGGGAEGWDADGSLKAIGDACRQWDRATRQGAYSNLSFGHTWGSIIRRNMEEFRTHPEYFRIDEKGERESFGNHPRGENPPPEAMHFCVSNPGLMKLCVKDRVALLEEMRQRAPTQSLVSMDPNDGHRPCHCEKCQALGNNSDRVYHLGNFVAREIRKVHPEAQVGVMIYSPFDTPPLNTKVEPNLVNLMALAFNSSGLSYDQLATGWVKAGASKLLVYPYYGIVQWTNAMPAGSPTFERISRDIPFFQKNWSVVATLQETGSTWGRMGPAMYLARKLLWDLEADAPAIYSQYFRDAFGSGAKEMRALYDLWDTPQGSNLTDTNIARWLQLADKAVQVTEGEAPAVRRRIEDILAYLHFITLYPPAKAAQGEKDKAKLMAKLKELFAFNWRIRHRQVVQTHGFYYFTKSWLDPYFPKDKGAWFHMKEAVPGYEESWPWTLHAQTKSKAVWQENEADYTSAEIRAFFQADLSKFSALVAKNRTFSNDLVPLFEGPPVTPNYAPASGGLLRQAGRWIFHIDQPTTLHITFQTQEHPTNKNKPGHVHEATLSDASGKVLYQDQPLPYSGGNGQAKVSEIDIQLQPGLYRLEARGAWNSSCRPIFQPAVKYVHEQSIRFSTLLHYYTPGYIYVPKGTQELRFNNDGYLTFKAPSWAKPQTFDRKTTAGLNILPVGPDDGKVWELRHVTTGGFQLLNIPPYVAMAKENLLVPREVKESEKE